MAFVDHSNSHIFMFITWAFTGKHPSADLGGGEWHSLSDFQGISGLWAQHTKCRAPGAMVYKMDPDQPEVQLCQMGIILTTLA